MMHRWPPDARVTNYRGPYPIRELHQARKVLIRCLQDRSDPFLQSMLPKIGIDPLNGCVLPSPLPPVIHDIKPLLTTNGHHLSDFPMRAPVPQVIPLIPPLHRGNALLPCPPSLHFRPETSHMQNNVFDQNYPSSDLRFAFPTDGEFRAKPLLATPPQYFNNDYPDNGSCELSEENSFSPSTNDQSNFTNDQNYPENAEDNHRDSSISTISSNAEKSASIGDICKIDVDISNDALRQILAMVAQAQQTSSRELTVSESHLDARDQSHSLGHDEAGHKADTITDNGGTSAETSSCETKPRDLKLCDTEKPAKDDEQNDQNQTTVGNMEICAKTSSDEAMTAQTFHVFKCDYCKVIRQQDNEMNIHLKQSNHPSGSKYLARHDEHSQLKLLYTEQSLALRNPTRTRNNTVIACPQCRVIFDDIFVCSSHYKYEHNDQNGYHVICPVIHSEIIRLACSLCCEHFETWQTLCDHWLSFPTHCPFNKSANHQVFHIFICPACNRMFSDDFAEAAVHFTSYHQEHIYQIEAKQVMMPMRREKLLEFNPDINSNGINEEISVLERLCASHGLTVVGLQAVNEQINKLKQKLTVS